MPRRGRRSSSGVSKRGATRGATPGLAAATEQAAAYELGQASSTTTTTTTTGFGPAPAVNVQPAETELAPATRQLAAPAPAPAAQAAAHTAEHELASATTQRLATPVLLAPRLGTPIEEPEKILSEGADGYQVVRRQDRVIKRNPHISLGEGEVMEFIAKNTKIPVPRVHRFEEGYIEMAFVDGERLDRVWDELTREEKWSIKGQLRVIIDQLREFKGNGESIIGLYQDASAMEDDPFRDDRPFRGLRNLALGGPFNDEESFNDYLLSGLPRGYSRKKIASGLRTGHEIYLTHGCLTPDNILVQGGTITAVLSWKLAGWYPDYWELVSICRGDEDDWLPGFQDMASFWFPDRYDEEFRVERLLELHGAEAHAKAQAKAQMKKELGSLEERVRNEERTQYEKLLKLADDRRMEAIKKYENLQKEQARGRSKRTLRNDVGPRKQPRLEDLARQDNQDSQDSQDNQDDQDSQDSEHSHYKEDGADGSDMSE